MPYHNSYWLHLALVGVVLNVFHWKHWLLCLQELSIATATDELSSNVTKKPSTEVTALFLTLCLQGFILAKENE